MNGEKMRETLRITKALSDIQRIRILMILRSGELCVCQIVEVLGLAPSTVSKHLSLLAGAELVDVRKEGRWSYYRLPDETVPAPIVRNAIDLLRNALREDSQILADLKKLNMVTACLPENLSRRQRGGGGCGVLPVSCATG